MISQQDDSVLIACRQLIGQKIGWGKSDGWSTQDFEQLSEQIASQTGVTLSVTTLKRVWGRVRYDSAPTATTLNTLVQFIGYTNWHQFREQHTVPGLSEVMPSSVLAEPTPDQSLAALPKPVSVSGHKRWWLAGGLVVGLVGILVFFLNYASPRQLNPNDFSFSSQPVAKVIPNSVVFRYDATAAPTDSVFIQQSWDPRRRELVPRNGHEHSSIYYYPGFFRARLVVGKQIMQEHNLLIPSEGWNVAVMQEPVPVYVRPTDFMHNGALNLPVSVIEQQHIPMQPKPPTVQYRYVKAFADLRADNFVLETRLKNTFAQGASVCQRSLIMILCKNNIFAIPLSAKGCVGDMTLYLAGHRATAKTADLSAFGVDFSQWVTLRCEVRNKHVTLFIDDRKVYEATAPQASVDIVGISYSFEGSGAVDFVRFRRADGTTAFVDAFGSPGQQNPSRSGDDTDQERGKIQAPK
ncbi:hypothetical protein [Fibrella arboris]|uniref:hypothetical protein n=1 Tax=Fibrella arboris TaxID=3242486 RepID=UPI00351F8B13